MSLTVRRKNESILLGITDRCIYRCQCRHNRFKSVCGGEGGVMQKILRYKTFQNSDDFVSWQVSDNNIRVTQVIPILSDVYCQIFNEKEGLGQVTTSVFVVYFLDREDR